MSRFLAPDRSLELCTALCSKLVLWESFGLYPGDLLFTRFLSVFCRRDTLAAISLLEFVNNSPLTLLVERHYLVGVYGKPRELVLRDAYTAMVTGNSYRPPKGDSKYRGTT